MFNFLYSVVSFVIALFFIALGIIGVLLPWSTTLRTDMIEYILANSIAISLFGFGFMIVGGTMVLNLILSNRKKYYYSKVGNNFIAVDEVVIAQYLRSYWEQIFPHQEVPTQLVLKKNIIRITADLPYKPAEEQKMFVEHVKQDLRNIFTQVLGYPNEFFLSVSFQPKPAYLKDER